MSKPGLILIGAGGHARSCIDVIEQQGQYQIAGLVGLAEDAKPILGSRPMGFGCGGGGSVCGGEL